MCKNAVYGSKSKCEVCDIISKLFLFQVIGMRQHDILFTKSGKNFDIEFKIQHMS